MYAEMLEKENGYKIHTRWGNKKQVSDFENGKIGQTVVKKSP